MAEMTPQELLYALRDRGKVVGIHRMGERLYELDGRHYRYFLVPEKDRHPGEGPWRAEEVVGFEGGNVQPGPAEK